MRLTEAERDGLDRTPSNLLEPYIESLISRHCALEREAAIAEAEKLVKNWKFMACSDADGLQAEIRALAKSNLLEAHDAEVREAALLETRKVHADKFHARAEVDALRAENEKLRESLRWALPLAAEVRNNQLSRSKCDHCGQDLSGREFDGHYAIFCHKPECVRALRRGQR